MDLHKSFESVSVPGISRDLGILHFAYPQEPINSFAEKLPTVRMASRGHGTDSFAIPLAPLDELAHGFSTLQHSGSFPALVDNFLASKKDWYSWVDETKTKQINALPGAPGQPEPKPGIGPF